MDFTLGPLNSYMRIKTGVPKHGDKQACKSTKRIYVEEFELSSIDQKISLVTGGVHRIGRAIALALAEHGSHVVIHFNQSEKEARRTAQDIETLGVSS